MEQTEPSARNAQRLGEAALDRLFRTSRSHNGWHPAPLSDSLMRELYDLTKWGPTAANATPARFVFIQSQSAKERLKPHLSAGNVEKTMNAPCCAIIAYDTQFYELMPKLFPSRDMRALFVGKEALIDETAKRSSTLQGAYFMLAARALGLDCGPMSGFNPATLDADFFPDGRWKSNFLCCLGYGSEVNLFPRNPRLDFDEACLVL
jgi:3-hydroxypropanoate dehydrogenase